MNGFTILPTKGGYDLGQYEPGLVYDYDLDSFRDMPNRHRLHIVKNMYRAFGLEAPKTWNRPWLVFSSYFKGIDSELCVFNVTERWQENTPFNWRRQVDAAKRQFRDVWFVGLKVDHERFTAIAGDTYYAQTEDFVEMARIIRAAGKFVCNQSVGLVIAQGIGREYYLLRKAGKTNTLMFTPQEHLLNVNI